MILGGFVDIAGMDFEVTSTFPFLLLTLFVDGSNFEANDFVGGFVCGRTSDRFVLFFRSGIIAGDEGFTFLSVIKVQIINKVQFFEPYLSRSKRIYL